ncbi:threonine ammonia-lyase IlvA [Xylanibacillus composti]|uniref:L-threonine dehydratase n=1 Tax=Xylanibacillus composti TaxID=1572762 RepID=A0A8J4H3R1_9BACL|nr:threonine ammonia-lyase IlvA [Xylanibacillus composti]GIQ68986.1 L-threonine dehydratase [Xylanibacillus composti]
MALIQVEDILQADRLLQKAVDRTPLLRNEGLSQKYGCQMFLKREDLQVVRSFKIRGAYHFMQTLTEKELANGVVCASAGNHAQGVAYACKDMDVKGTIFMPATTPRQKVNQVRFFGGEAVEVQLVGDTFDDSYREATSYAEQQGKVFIHPFDDERTIIGQGTVGLEILNQMKEPLDVLILAVGGGGLAAGVGSYVKRISPHTRIIGVEPEGAPAMRRSLDSGERVVLESIDKFVDGAAVKQVGERTLDICREVLDDVLTVPEGKVCTAILDMYNLNAIVVEPAGALPVAALDFLQEEIRGKNVVCLISGGNNDISRMQEIKDRSLIYEGLQHYFIINFPQRSGALREFLDKVLGPGDDITRFEYTKKTSKENGPALVGIELRAREDYEPLLARMEREGIQYLELNKNPELFHFLI